MRVYIKWLEVKDALRTVDKDVEDLSQGMKGVLDQVGDFHKTLEEWLSSLRRERYH